MNLVKEVPDGEALLVRPGDVWCGPMGNFFAAYRDSATGKVYMRGLVGGRAGALYINKRFENYMLLDGWSLVERTTTELKAVRP